MERTGFFTKILVLTGFVGIAKCNGLNSDALMPDIDVRILSLRNCSDDNDYAMVYRDVSVEKKSKNLYTLQAKILVTRDMPGPIKVVNKVDACKQRDNNCETFTTLTTEDACKELEEEKGQLYQTFKEAKMEHLRCPLKKDTYILSPCEIKVPEGAKSLVAKSENWKVISRMFHGEEELTCFIVLLEMKPKESGRKKNKPAKEEKEKNDVEEKEEDKGKEKEKGKGKEKEKGKGKEKENNKKKGR